MNAGKDETTASPEAGRRWQQLEALFDQGIALPADQRDAWLASLPIAPDLRDELSRLLAADSAGQTLQARVEAVVASAALAPAMGERIGPWRLVEQIGAGGMGAVFLVERVDGGFTQQAALKLVRGVATPQSIRALRHERRVLAALEHPGIARLLDGGETAQGQPYLVMEYVRGEPITAAVLSRGIALRDRLRLLREVALAVHHAHRQLVIHRDIKPGNVLLREDGRPVLLDFGIAKLLDADAAAHTGTAAYFTPAYASPEQRHGKPVTTATDIYALGLLLVELITGQPAAVDGLGRLRAPSEQMPRGRRSAVRGDLDRIVLRACAEEPERRYESAAALANDIERHMAGLPVRAAPDSRWYVLGKFLRRHPAGVALALATAAVLAVSAWQVVEDRNRALRAEQRAEQEARSAQAVTAYLVGLFREADPGSGRGRSLRPAELIDRGVARLAAEQALEPAARAHLLGALGSIYNLLGLPQKGSQTLEDAVRHARQSGVDGVLADALASLGAALEERGQFDRAEHVLAEAHALYLQQGDPVQAANAKAGIGLVQSRMGRFAEAERTLSDAHTALLATQGRDSLDAIRVLAFRSEVLRESGRAAQAREELEHLLSRMRARLPEDHPRLLEAYGYYANTLLLLDDTARAQEIFELMLLHRQRLLEQDRSPLGFVHNGLGTLYYQQGRTREAAEQMALALAIGERTLGPDDSSLALDLNNVGSLYEEMGDYARAEPLLRRAYAIMERAQADRPAQFAQFRQNLGRLLMLAGKADEAFALVEAPIADEPGDPWAMQRARRAFHRAEWQRRYGDPDEAARLLDEAAPLIEAVSGRDSARYAAVLRSRGLLALADGLDGEARLRLQEARDLLATARGDGYIGVAEIDLDLAELDLREGQRGVARRRLDAAGPVIEAVAVAAAPQRARLAELQKAVGG
jgi:eukaryotic-like serine/threonine-protein kinase